LHGNYISARTSYLALSIQKNLIKEKEQFKGNQNIVLGFDYTNVKFHHEIQAKTENAWRLCPLLTMIWPQVFHVTSQPSTAM